MIRKITYAAFAAAVALASPSQAALLDFSFTGDETFAFQLDSNPAPDFSFPSLGFIVAPEASPGSPTSAFFFSGALGGGLGLEGGAGPLDFFVATGAQLYSGSEGAPVFTPGTFELTSALGSANYLLTISPVVAVPEPASWALLIGGFALVGGLMRHRQTRVRYTPQFN